MEQVHETSTKCIVCGMRLAEQSDYPGGDFSKDYCYLCGTSESVYPYETLVESMARYIKSAQGIHEGRARRIAAWAVDNSEAVEMGRISVPR